MNLYCSWCLRRLDSGIRKTQACTRLLSVRMTQPGVRAAAADVWVKSILGGCFVSFVTVKATSASIRPVQQYSLRIFHYIHNLDASVGISVICRVLSFMAPSVQEAGHLSQWLDCWYPPEDCQSSPSPRRCFFHSSLRSTTTTHPPPIPTPPSHEQSMNTARMVLEGSNQWKNVQFLCFPNQGKLDILTLSFKFSNTGLFFFCFSFYIYCKLKIKSHICIFTGTHIPQK